MIISNVGFFSLLLGLISSFAVFLCSIFNIKHNSPNLEKKIYKFLTLQFFFVVTGFFILLYSGIFFIRSLISMLKVSSICAILLSGISSSIMSDE